MAWKYFYEHLSSSHDGIVYDYVSHGKCFVFIADGCECHVCSNIIDNYSVGVCLYKICGDKIEWSCG